MYFFSLYCILYILKEVYVSGLHWRSHSVAPFYVIVKFRDLVERPNPFFGSKIAMISLLPWISSCVTIIKTNKCSKKNEGESWEK